MSYGGGLTVRRLKGIPVWVSYYSSFMMSSIRPWPPLPKGVGILMSMPAFFPSRSLISGQTGFPEMGAYPNSRLSKNAVNWSGVILGITVTLG